MAKRDYEQLKAVIEGVRQSILAVARRRFGPDADVQCRFDFDLFQIEPNADSQRLFGVDVLQWSSLPVLSVNGREFSLQELGELLGWGAARSAKEQMLRRIREAKQ